MWYIYTHLHSHTLTGEMSHTCIHTLVDKANFMVGSYGPKNEAQEFQTPVEDAPSGLLARGTYNVKSKFTDDDKNIYLEWEWALKIVK